MSYKHVGPIGWEFSGDKARCFQLIGPARVLVQQALDKISARGGRGQQMEQRRLADGSTIRVLVVWNFATPVVRAVVSSPISTPFVLTPYLSYVVFFDAAANCSWLLPVKHDGFGEVLRASFVEGTGVAELHAAKLNAELGSALVPVPEHFSDEPIQEFYGNSTQFDQLRKLACYFSSFELSAPAYQGSPAVVYGGVPLTTKYVGGWYLYQYATTAGVYDALYLVAWDDDIELLYCYRVPFTDLPVALSDLDAYKVCEFDPRPHLTYNESLWLVSLSFSSSARKLAVVIKGAKTVTTGTKTIVYQRFYNGSEITEDRRESSDDYTGYSYWGASLSLVHDAENDTYAVAVDKFELADNNTPPVYYESSARYTRAQHQTIWENSGKRSFYRYSQTWTTPRSFYNIEIPKELRFAGFADSGAFYTVGVSGSVMYDRPATESFEANETRQQLSGDSYQLYTDAGVWSHTVYGLNVEAEYTSLHLDYPSLYEERIVYTEHVSLPGVPSRAVYDSRVVVSKDVYAETSETKVYHAPYSNSVVSVARTIENTPHLTEPFSAVLPSGQIESGHWRRCSGRVAAKQGEIWCNGQRLMSSESQHHYPDSDFESRRVTRRAGSGTIQDGLFIWAGYSIPPLVELEPVIIISETIRRLRAVIYIDLPTSNYESNVLNANDMEGLCHSHASNHFVVVTARNTLTRQTRSFVSRAGDGVKEITTLLPADAFLASLI